MSADSGRVHKSRSFVLLACVLLLLFPVISATDDMHAMRPEMEESSSSKHIAKNIAGDKSASFPSPIGSPFQISSFTFYSGDQIGGKISSEFTSQHVSLRRDVKAPRAPPKRSSAEV